VVGLVLECIAARPLEFAVVLLINDAFAVSFVKLFVETGRED
jgi:hypothetical protein